MGVDLRTKLGHVELPNPIMTASGCAGAGRELAQFVDVSKIGAIVTKSVMLAPRSGRPTHNAGHALSFQCASSRLSIPWSRINEAKNSVG